MNVLHIHACHVHVSVFVCVRVWDSAALGWWQFPLSRPTLSNSGAREDTLLSLTESDPAERQRSWSLASCCPQSPPSERLHPGGWCIPWQCPQPRQQRWSRGSRRWSWCPGGWSTWRPGQLDLTSNWCMQTHKSRDRDSGETKRQTGRRRLTLEIKKNTVKELP